MKSGESLSVIASRYNTTTATLKSHNNLRSTSLAIGQKIKIPGVEDSQQSAAEIIAMPTSHKVKSGEALSVIAQQYGRSAKELRIFNNLSSSRLLVGQILKIPAEGEDIPEVPEFHIVASGQSLSVIAQMYGTTSKQLKAYNHLRSNALAIGQKLKIPTEKIQQTTHKVRSGESLSVIAQRYGISTRAIISINNLRSHSLAIGQVLTIPMS
ncbi:LysM peptidoglycan-binding domain-containing protein [Psychromonas sp.]|nr:LysM peptidoglycan-binding domain-containing protein [Psychromonas sp.]